MALEISDAELKELIDCLLQESTETVARAETNILKLEGDPSNKKSIEEVFRAVHTIKGSAAGVGLTGLSSFAHELENLLSEVKKGRTVTPALISVLLIGVDAIRRWFQEIARGNKENVDVQEALDALKSLTVEDELQQALSNSDDGIMFILDPKSGAPLSKPTALSDIGSPKKRVAPSPNPTQTATRTTGQDQTPATAQAGMPAPTRQEPKESPETETSNDDLVTLPMKKIESLLDLFGEQVILHSILENIKNDLDVEKDQAKRTIDLLSKITYNLQNAAMSLRLVSLRSFFMKMKRTVRDASIQLKKDVQLICEGEDTELDKHMADKLASFVTHMMRNSVDHGVEDSEKRIAAGKPAKGTIVMQAYLHGGFFYLSIVDDGGGINKAKVKEKAIRQGLISETQVLSEDEILQLIFEPGFSTKEQATELSGRGFGMDIALTEITRLHGTLTVSSEEGKSTEFLIRLPLTLAIFNGVAIRAGQDTFILPSSEVIDFEQLRGVENISLDPKRTLVNIKDRVMPLIPLAETLSMNRNAVEHRKKKQNTDLNSAGVAILVRKNGVDHALKVDELIGIQRVVLKNLGKELKGCPAVTGGAILSDGRVALILEAQKVLEIWEASVR